MALHRCGHWILILCAAPTGSESCPHGDGAPFDPVRKRYEGAVWRKNKRFWAARRPRGTKWNTLEHSQKMSPGLDLGRRVSNCLISSIPNWIATRFRGSRGGEIDPAQPTVAVGYRDRTQSREPAGFPLGVGR